MNNNIHKFQDIAFKDRINSILSRNSLPIITSSVQFAHELFSCFLNSALSITVIGFLLPSSLIFGYIISLVACSAIILSLNRLIASASAAHENIYITYSTILGNGWASLLLGNSYNTNIWQTKIDAEGKLFYLASNHLAAVRQIGNLLLATASLGPSIYLIFDMVSTQNTSSSVLAALFVSLTRVFLILNSLSALVYQILEWPATLSRLNILLDAMNELKIPATKNARDGKPIQINGISVNNLSEALHVLTISTCGRHTLRGVNGCGKTTMLLGLKAALGATAFILPARHGDLLWENQNDRLFTGQQSSARINEMLQIEEIQYFLLDEWDANLDTSTKASISDRLDYIAKTKVVVEIRH